MLTTLYIGFYLGLLLWPNYLAIALPGLPWITVTRLFGMPLAIVLLVCVSTSAEFRKELKEVLAAAPFIARFLIGFVAIQLLSLAFSQRPVASFQKFILAQIYWTAIFFGSCYLFRRPGRVRLWSQALIVIALYLCAIGLWEWRIGRVPWAGHIPSFLRIEDETVLRILAGGRRAATGIYRVQSTFSTSLSLAEFLGFTTPFLIHAALEARRILTRAFAVCMTGLVFFVIIQTDSRLGAVSFFASFLLYAGLWGLRRWAMVKNSVFGPAVSLSFPAMTLAFFVASLFIGRLRRMIWGGGEHQFSTEARFTQWESGLPMIFQRPFGHGVGEGAEVLGFTNPAGMLTIDSYYLTIGLEYGAIGFLLYFGMFVAAAIYGTRQLVTSRDPEATLLIPLVIAVLTFLIVKMVFSQQDTHPLLFMMLGMISALTWRSNQNSSRAPEKSH